MRRKDKQVSSELALEWLKNGSSGVLSLVDESGMPYCVPVSYIYHADAIWIHGAREGKKLECIANNDNACFCVFKDHGPISEKYSVRYESAIVQGKANIVKFVPMVEEVLYMISKKYTDNDDDAIMRYIEKGIGNVAIIRISIDEITGKRSPVM